MKVHLPPLLKVYAATLVMILAGCAATDFVRPPDSTLVLGRTTYQ